MVQFLLIFGLLLVVFQMFMPEVGLIHTRPFLLPILVAYSALRFTPVRALGVAVGLGLFLDLFSAGRLGVSALCCILMTLFILSQMGDFKFDYIPHVMFLTLLGTFLYLTIDYLFFCIQVQTWRWYPKIWEEILGKSLLDTVLCVPFFWLFDVVNKAFLPGKEPRSLMR